MGFPERFSLTLSLHPGEFKIGCNDDCLERKTNGSTVRSGRLASSSASIRALQLSGLCPVQAKSGTERAQQILCV